MQRKKKIKNSVVIACYNCEKSVELCLKSVLANKPDEVIVVNDASTDDSLKIMKKYPIKIINLKKRSGVTKAEKIGIEKSSGNIIFITNADIVVPPNWIERHLELQKKADCVGGWVRYDVKPSLNEIAPLPAYNCSFKRKVLNAIGNIDENLADGSEDAEFFLRAKSRGFKVISDSSIPVLHYHNIGSYKNEIRRYWAWGYRLGKIIRKYPHGRLMSKWFLILPIYWLGIFLKDLKKFLKDYFLKIIESIAKFIGFMNL